jgi:hypothetical protein
MSFAGYVSVSMQLYCVGFHCLSLHVSAYMAIFRCVEYFYFHMREGFCFGAFFLPFFHLVTFCMIPSVGWVKYEVLFFIIIYAIFGTVIFIYVFLTYSCFSCAVFLRYFCCFLACVCLLAEKSSEAESFRHMKIKISYTPEDGHVGRNM